MSRSHNPTVLPPSLELPQETSLPPWTSAKDARDLAKKIGALAPKASVKLTVLHSGSEKSSTLTLGEMPNAKEARASADEGDSGADLGKLGLLCTGRQGRGRRR